MPLTKQYSQQQQHQILQHTSHSTTVTATTSNPQHHLHQHQQHVQQISLAASSSIHHQTHHHQQQQSASSTHMIHVSEEYLGQASSNHNTGNMMISTTGEVINQQQIFKIVSTDGTTGNMIIDATNQNANSTTNAPKVLLSNLTVLSKQQTAQGQIIGGSHQQPQNAGQTINFVNAKNLYTTAGGGIAGGSKQQKFTVATANVTNYKGSATKQTSATVNTQYIQQPSSIGPQKINITGGNRNMQMLTTRVQNAASSNTTSNLANNNSVAVISNNNAPAQTMVLQQPQKYIASNTIGSKMTTATLGAGGNIIKKSTTGTLRMNNSHNTTATTKLINNLQTAQGVKTFITQTPCMQSQTQQNMNQLTMQHHATKSGSKSKFVKQYNNAILNSAGAVAIATLPHQQSNSQNNMQAQQLQPQTAYINHQKSGGIGSAKINKINSKYAQSANMVAQLPPGTQLHQKSINQMQQQQQQQQQHQHQHQHQQQHIQTTGSNSNIKFVNAQGTVIQQQQQQSLTPQKINKQNQNHHQQQYQNLQNYDAVGGNHLFNQSNANQPAGSATTSISSGTTTLPLATTTGSSLLTDDVMMVNGTQMTDELSARILQSMSQKSFSNQRYQQQQHNVFQTKTSTTTTTAVSNSINSNNNCSNNINMLPPPPCVTQSTIIQTNNNSNILLSPREYTLYSAATSASTVGIVSVNQQQSQQQSNSSNIHYNNSANSTSTASSNITAGSFSSNNYITVSNSNNNMTTIETTHTSGTSATNGVLSANPSSGSTNTARQAQSAPGSRSQSMERKLHESSMSRKSTEYYKVSQNSVRGSSHHNNLSSATAAIAQTGGGFGNMSSSLSNIMATATPSSSSPLPMPRPPSLPPATLIMEPQAQVIHLQATKMLPGTNNSSNDDDDDIIGEEVRPQPVDTEDIRLRILHAVLFDHTYVNPMPSVLPTSFAVQLPPSTTSSTMVLTSAAPAGLTAATIHGQQWSLGGIGAIAAAGPGGVAQKNYTLYSTQLSRIHQDAADPYTTFSSTSRLAIGDIDPGEETETAPEAELEDDSVTRCICDLTHDDGYMICCDKCCAWQHVDCMGIDRQNIPDEYLCELCQPRIVDKARARSLQLLKRKEQQQQILLTTQTQAVSSTGTAAGSANGSSMSGVANLSNDVLSAQQRLVASSGGGYILTGNMSTDSAALQLLAAGGSNLKKNKMNKKPKDGVSGKRTKKSEKLAAAAVAGLTTTGKPARKETKKNTKRKKTGAHDSGGSTVGMTVAEKHAANLRQWIENYELAVTNHYSPELRARLHAISKQPSLLQSILNTENPILKEFSNGSLDNRATTVPHAGGKILISNLDIVPNSPICELRGKYMLTTQYRTQNTSMNMNSPPPNNYHLASYKAHKTPGPFIFFYQLSGTEVAVSNQFVPQTTTTTMLNPDGTYTTTTTTLPAQQSPPTFLKGPEICVDTRTYGNEARFVRRSCRPNAEIQHLFEKGTIHLFIVALTDIRASTEITIRHEPHDLLAVENKKSFSIIIQPTSTSCACGLTKDCIFGPPIPQLPPTAKSNVGRKSVAHSGGVSGNAGNFTAKQRKTNQQNFNRNRSISSSASGDSNMGVAATANTTAISLNSPNNVGKMPTVNKIVNNNTLMPLTGSCNSNLSNASSTSSTLMSIVHDSGVCTSSSSPSVSLPSPTQHMHSPMQQQQAHQQQQQQLLHSTQTKAAVVQLLPQQQQQQMMQSLPTPLVLTSSNLLNQHQQKQQQSVLQQSTMIIQTHQSVNVLPQPVTSPSPIKDVNNANEQKQSQTSLCLPTTPIAVQPLPHTQTQQFPIHQQIMLQEQQQQQNQQIQRPPSLATTPGDVLETISTETSIAAVALQSLNTSHSPNTLLSTPPASGNSETQLQCTKIQQQPFVIVPTTEVKVEQLQQSLHQQNHSSDNMIVNTSGTSLTSSPQQPQQQIQQQQQHKSPQKNNQSQQNNSHSGRKTPGKHARTTSFSEDNEHHHYNEESSVTSTPTYSSTPKEKPKLSREDRKMEAILRAIEKMERSQQRKQEQKQTKRQNAGSHNTTPTSPNKTDSADNTAGSKRSTNHAASTGRSKKKRRAGAKSGQGGNHRKRRQSRLNSQESVDEGNNQDPNAVTPEPDGCAEMQSSSPVQTNTSLTQQHFSALPSSNLSECITTTEKLTTETTNNVDQAAGLLMAFANPDINAPDVNSSYVPPAEQHLQQSPLRASSQFIMSSSEAATSPPPTPPSQVSSACLLIEAAVGPLEPNLDDNHTDVHNAEFKYPLQAKTKKHLMNNWLHETEDTPPVNDVTTLPEHNSQSLQTFVPSEVCSSAAAVSVASGGLDSLLQAAMSDLKQSETDAEEPQNLSIAAQKVEEFIQQTEASVCGLQTQPQTGHSYEYELRKQHQRTYANLPTPAVDLTLKTPLTIGPNPSSEMNSSKNQNFHMPLQVSTCSNNSSVKKRWLRQAISEETYEEFQHTFPSMTPSPSTGMINSNFTNSQMQPCSPATNYVPNGFTTPLKKRRLLLTGKDESDENLSQSCGDLSVNSTPSPPSVLVQQQQQQHQQQIQMQMEALQQNQPALYKFDNEEMAQDMHEDDVDVEKCENETKLHPAEITQNIEYPKVEMNQEQDVDITTSPQDDLHFENRTKIDVKHENDVMYVEEKECLETSAKQTDQSSLSEFNDQEDDVDILRSPSPGREMIKAEDNLVKIEPEDISGMEDVKIDVEREESMAADDDVVTQHKKSKEETVPIVYKQNEQNNQEALLENVEIKKEFKITNLKEEDTEQKQNLDRDIVAVESKTEIHEDLPIKTEPNESHIQYEEPKSKRLKLQKSEVEEEEKLASVKKTLTKEESSVADEINVKPEFSTTTKVNQMQEIALHCSSKDDENVLKTDFARKEKQLVSDDAAEVTSSASPTLFAKKLSPVHTFTDLEPSTPPLPLAATIGSGIGAPMQRHKSLSDDDIQARLHSFHKENILFLQSRNKKTKSSSSLTTSNAKGNSASTNGLVNNNDHHKNRTSSSSNHQHHHNHHHHHDGKEKSEKSNLKHRKNPSGTPSGTSKKQKLHKRKRATGSNSSNNHKNSANLHTSTTSVLNKKPVISSTSASSESSKKLKKSLKKSSSGSSTSSNTSLSSYSSSAVVLQNCYPSSSSATANTSSLNADKERVAEKDKHHRHSSSSNYYLTPTAPHTLSKKRQLNFELELTKDMHLLNSVITGANKHKKETSRLLPDEQSHVTAKKSRKESSSSQKEELKNGTNNKLGKIEKQQDKKCSISNAGSASIRQTPVFNIANSSQPVITPVSNTATITTPVSMPTEEPKSISTIVYQPSQSPLTLTPILREHPTLPHFNNVVVATSSPLMNHLQPLTPVQSQPPTPVVLPQNIPNHVNSPSFISPVHCNSQLQQPPLPPTPPPAGVVLSPLSIPNVNSASQLPFYNTIYGKLLDNPASSPSLSTPLTLSNTNTTTTTSPSSITTASVASASGVLSEYLDTKVKSYNTLGGYVSHTAFFGLNNAAVIKDMPASSVSSAVVSTSAITVGLSTAHIKDSSMEMPSPLPPSSTVSCSTLASPSSSGNSASTVTPLKIHTKTASHDPRLNPQLTAPEPPPQPKRKLSINEYRKRMQQSSSNDSNNGNGTIGIPTTSPSSLDSMSSSHLVPMTMSLTNKCTLNSPDHVAQSVDSQIQKEIMSTTSAASSSSSSLDSLNSSNSSTSLNDTLLKSSSFVEEDSTKGQFNAAPTLLEKQQESLCARLKSLKEKQGLGTTFIVTSGNRSRFSSFSESVVSTDFSLRKEDDDLNILRNRNLSISSSIGGGDLLDNCLEEISSTSTSMSSSREPSPERCYTTHHKILTASATTTVTNTSTTSHNNNGQTSRQHHQHHHQQHNINCDKSEMTSLERKKSVDTA